MSNFQHPELRSGEMFLTNINVNSDFLTRTGYKSVRVGSVAYYCEEDRESPDSEYVLTNVRIPSASGMFPIFVSIEEYECLSIERDKIAKASISSWRRLIDRFLTPEFRKMISETFEKLGEV